MTLSALAPGQLVGPSCVLQPRDGKISLASHVMCATFRASGIDQGGERVSDQERDKLSNETDDEGGEDVEAHKLSNAADEDSDDVEAHKLGGKDV